MSLENIPSELLNIIVNEMNDNIYYISLTSKRLYEICKERLENERAQCKRRYYFFDKCNKSIDNPVNKLQKHVNIFWNAFNGVTTIEECNFVREKYKKKFGDSSFMSRVRYTIDNSFQSVTEVWESYMRLYSN